MERTIMIGNSFILLVIVLSASIAFAADRISSPDKSLIGIIEPFLKSNGTVAENVMSIIRVDGVSLVEIDFRSHNVVHAIQGRSSIRSNGHWIRTFSFYLITAQAINPSFLTASFMLAKTIISERSTRSLAARLLIRIP